MAARPSTTGVSIMADTHSTAVHQDLLVAGNKTMVDVNEDVSRPLENFPTSTWWACFGVALAALGIGALVVTTFVMNGLGVLGLNQPNGWGIDIVNFVFWVGIGHAGTLISAILFLFRQKWRTAINRSAEAMTIFAVITALTFPLLHTGRPWLAAYWLLPYPNQRQLWVNFRSPLLWDVFAVGTYFTVSAVFWFVGLIPDLASIRDRAKNNIRKLIFTILSMGWRGSNKNWAHYESAYMILAGLSTPLVLSVHTIVSFDFAVAQLPGWHATIFPPYFVAGAIFSGFAMVVTLLVIMREAFNLKAYITMDHLERMNKIIMATGLMVGYAYACEFFIAWYSGGAFEKFIFINRAFGPYWWAYWTMTICNAFIPQVFWWRSMRRSIPAMFIVSLFVNIGMWFERYVIVATSLHRDFLPSSWGYYTPTWFDWGWTIGAFGLFFVLFLLFVRLLPTIAMAEVKSVMPQGGHHE
jgi:molybdopterin-containing oxidoreductase family membrane subunit